MHAHDCALQLPAEPVTRPSVAGPQAVAIDLPGYGNTPLGSWEPGHAMSRAELVRAVFKHFAVGALDKAATVLVSPSMSGLYAAAYVEWYGNELDLWVAVAPVGIKGFEAGRSPRPQITERLSVLAVYGDQDPIKSQAKTLAKVVVGNSSALAWVPGCMLHRNLDCQLGVNVVLYTACKLAHFCFPTAAHGYMHKYTFSNTVHP